MYYITPKSSETGRKFAGYIEMTRTVFDQQKQLAYELGFARWLTWQVTGTIACVQFDAIPDPKIWKQRKSEPDKWVPRRDTKAGKEVAAKLENGSKIQWQDLNSCIGLDDVFYHIGFAVGKDNDFYGFEVDKAELKIPEDCEEVTSIRYNKLFRS